MIIDKDFPCQNLQLIKTDPCKSKWACVNIQLIITIKITWGFDMKFCQ